MQRIILAVMVFILTFAAFADKVEAQVYMDSTHKYIYTDCLLCLCMDKVTDDGYIQKKGSDTDSKNFVSSLSPDNIDSYVGKKIFFAVKIADDYRVIEYFSFERSGKTYYLTYKSYAKQFRDRKSLCGVGDDQFVWGYNKITDTVISFTKKSVRDELRRI